VENPIYHIGYAILVGLKYEKYEGDREQFSIGIYRIIFAVAEEKERAKQHKILDDNWEFISRLFNETTGSTIKLIS
jgi:hypothetical protein